MCGGVVACWLLATLLPASLLPTIPDVAENVTRI
jgi:hypothetical protein